MFEDLRQSRVQVEAVGVTLSRVEPDFLRDVLSDAWEQRARRRLTSR
jgi:hypothetical protein